MERLDLETFKRGRDELHRFLERDKDTSVVFLVPAGLEHHPLIRDTWYPNGEWKNKMYWVWHSAPEPAPVRFRLLRRVFSWVDGQIFGLRMVINVFGV